MAEWLELSLTDLNGAGSGLTEAHTFMKRFLCVGNGFEIGGSLIQSLQFLVCRNVFMTLFIYYKLVTPKYALNTPHNSGY